MKVKGHRAASSSMYWVKGHSQESPVTGCGQLSGFVSVLRGQGSGSRVRALTHGFRSKAKL